MILDRKFQWELNHKCLLIQSDANLVELTQINFTLVGAFLWKYFLTKIIFLFPKQYKTDDIANSDKQQILWESFSIDRYDICAFPILYWINLIRWFSLMLLRYRLDINQ